MTDNKIEGKLKLTPQAPLVPTTPGDPVPPNIAYPTDGAVTVNGVIQTQLPHPPSPYRSSAIR